MMHGFIIVTHRIGSHTLWIFKIPFMMVRIHNLVMDNVVSVFDDHRFDDQKRCFGNQNGTFFI